jgi:hypothetical protein
MSDRGLPGEGAVLRRTPSSRLAYRPFARVLLLSFLVPGVAPAAERDVFVSGLVLYTKLAPDSVEGKEHGKYPQLRKYDRHGGLAPDKIDVVGVVNGREVEVRIVLEVIPVVGLTNWQETEGITDTQLLESSKTMFPSALRLEKTVRLKGRTDVKYSDVDLSRLINSWKDKGYWPAELLFRLSVEPVAGETSLANNVMEYRLVVRPPD